MHSSARRRWRTPSDRLGQSESTRAMIELLKQGRRDGYGRPTRAIEDALACGCTDPAAVKYLMRAAQLERPRAEPVDVGELARFVCPQPEMSAYDELLEWRVR